MFKIFFGDRRLNFHIQNMNKTSFIYYKDLFLLIFFLFSGTDASGFSTRTDMKRMQLEAYSVIVTHIWFWFLAISALSFYFPILKSLVECYHFALIETGSLFSSLCPLIFRNILDKFPLEETTPNPGYNEIPSSLLSSFDTVYVDLSEDETIASDAESA